MKARIHRTILIVDDSPEDREMYRRYLMRDQDYEYTIADASLGAAGLALWQDCQQRQPDAVLLDYRLPDLDGLEFLAALQDQGQHKHLPVIMVTGVGNEAIAVQAIKAGAQDYLIKEQITPESLQLAVNGAIKTVQLQTQLQQRIDREQVIVQIAQKVARSLDLDEILHTTVEEVRHFLQTDRVVVFRLEPDGNGMVVAESVGADWRSILLDQIYDPCFAGSYVDPQRRGRVTAKADIYDGSIDSCHVELLAQCQVKANLVVPILHDEQLWGVLIAHHCAAPRQWQPLEIDLLQQLSTQVSVAIRQAELYQQAQHELVERQRAEAVLRNQGEKLRLAIEDLQQSEEFKNRVLESSSDCIKVLDLDGRLLYMNAGGMCLLEIDDLTPYLYSEWLCFWQGEYRQEAESALAAARSGKLGKFQGFCPTIKGAPKWWDVLVTPIRDSSGQVIQILSTSRDISDRKQAEADLQEQTKLLQVIVNSMGDALVAADQQGMFTIFNEAAQQMFGSLSSEQSPNEWSKTYGLFLADQQTHLPEDEVPLMRALRGERATDIEIFVRHDPALPGRWVSVNAYPLVDDSDRVKGGIVVCRDITERKRTEEELRQKNAILDVINEAAPIPIFVKNRQGQIIYANPATLAVLGKTADEVIGYRDGDLYPSPEDAARVMENDQRIMASGQTEVVEESPDGVQTFLGTKAPYYNKAGEVIGLIGISNNITDRVQIERDRERILQQKQAALAESERVNRIKDEFLAVLSHELRSPLNPILGWAKILQMHKLDETKTIEALASIERNAKAQAQLIDDLLDMARVLRGKLTLNVASVNLLRAIESALDTVQTAAIAKSIQIQPILSDVGQVSGDAVRLQQIVWNLLSNAVKFTANGGRVEIRLEQVDNQAQITITDTGKGISPDFLPHIFESFRQEDASVTRRHGGLGLGLAIVYQLVEAHGGTITADSLGEGKGATFIVKLPLSASLDAAQSDELQALDLDLTGIRVLTIDDEPDSRELLSVILAQAGAEVMTVSSAAEFLISLGSFQPNILVSDIGMKEVDGYTLLKQVRSLSREQGGQIPAIALTAYAGERDQQQALAAGFQKHISKPVEPNQLVAAIASVLSRNL
jgi:PAS domain S-box-containing protein